MSTTSHDARLIRLAISVKVELASSPDGKTGESVDLLVEVAPDATVRDLADALVRHVGWQPSEHHGLLRHLVTWSPADDETGAAGYLPADLLLAECGLYDGVLLRLCDRTVHRAPELFVDVERAPDDLFLVDERGTHRGRVTRLPVGKAVVAGPSPDGQRRLVIDDQEIPATALKLVNRGGSHVDCQVGADTGVFVSGTPTAAGNQQVLLPGGTISFRRDDTDFVSFALTTLAGLTHRSSIAKIRFDPAARLADPVYSVLSENLTRLEVPPAPPEHQPFPYEQIVVPLAIVAALWMATGSALTLLISPIAAAVPIINYFRQQRMAQNRYLAARKKWVDKLEQIDIEHTKAAGVEEGNLRKENPPPDVWTRRGYRRLAGLWSRTPDRPDFLRVSVGYGQLPSRYAVKLADGIDQTDEDFKRVMQVEGRQIDRDTVRPQLFDVPITVNLREHHVGIVGPSELVGYLATSVLLQVVCAQAPGTVGLAALLPSSELVSASYDWLKWLPHTLAGSTLLPSDRVFAGRDSCNRFLLVMRDLHQERHKYRLDEAADSFALLVVHEAAEIDIALLDEICELSNGQIRVLWLGSSADTAPQLITSVIQLNEDPTDSQDSTGVILSGDPELVHRPFALSLFRAAPSQSVRALAPLYDPRASGANAGIPPRVPLAAVTLVSQLVYPVRPRPVLGEALTVPLGVCQSGVLELDFVQDGPHVLIGGTTGSGKSELLQTMTCGLIGRYSPLEVNLFLVDFKGGATFAPFENLPHTIGYVSDLDQRNVDRALAFLRAELRRREKAFEELGHAKEYGQYLGRALRGQRDDILPRLIVIFDEFATIVQEFERSTLPAVIDIAQRGRSWGVHLVLATQQPTRDVVVPKVRANVNARIALRTLSPDDSQTIIDRPDATRIPRALPGRAMVCLEGNNIVEFQTAFAGTRYVEADAQTSVRVTEFSIASSGIEGSAVDLSPLDDGEPESQLQRLVAVVGTTESKPSAGSRQMPVPLEAVPRRHRRWTLPQTSADVEKRGQPSSLESITIGLVDLPEHQLQRQVEIDLQRGGCCIAGPNGSGRTTTLVTLAEQFALGANVNTVGVVCIDGGDRLGDILAKRMAGVASISMSRIEHVTRAIDQLWLIMRSRMSSLSSDAPAIAYGGAGPILLLIDGYDVLARAISPPGLTTWYSRLVDLLAHGRRHGIYTAMATRHVRDLDPAAQSTLAATFELHAHYEESGISPEERLPGFALDSTGHLVQFYLPACESTSQVRQLDLRLAEFLEPERWRAPSAYADVVGIPGSVVVGVDEVGMVPLCVDLTESHILIIGGARSGRSALLRDLAEQTSRAIGGAVGMLAPRAKDVGEPDESIVVLNEDDLITLNGFDAKGERAEYIAKLGLACLPDTRPLILIDDCHAIGTMDRASALESAIAALHQQTHIQLVVVTSAQAVNSSIISGAMKSSGVTVYLKPSGAASDTDDGWRVRNISFQHRPGLVYKPGDAIIQTDVTQHVVHIPSPAKGKM